MNSKTSLGEAVFPGEEYSELAESERQDIYEEIMGEQGYGFLDAEYVVLTGAPEPSQNLERAALAAEYLEENCSDRIPRVLTSPEQKLNLDYKLDGRSEYIFERMKAETSQDEVMEAIDRIDDDQRAVFVTHAYHAPRFENYVNEMSKEGHEDTRGSFMENSLEFFFSQTDENLSGTSMEDAKLDYLVLGLPSTEPDLRVGSEAIRSLPQTWKDKMKWLR